MANITSVVNLIFQAQNLGKVVGGLKGLEKGADGAAKGVRGINLAALETGAGLLALGKAIQVTAGFQDQIVDLGRVANIEGSLTDGTLSKVADEIKVLAPELGKTATEFSALAVESAKLGVAGDNVIAFTKPIAELSQISGLVGEQPAKLAKSFAALSSITGAGNDELETYAALANRLDDSIGGTIPTIVEFTRQTAAAGQIVGIGIGELAAYGSTLEALGVKSAVSYRAVNSLLVKLASPQTLSADAVEGLKQIGFTASEMADIMGRDAEGGVRLFLERVRELGKTDSQLALGAVKQLIGADYGDEILTLSGGLDKLNSALELTGQSSENLARYQDGLAKRQNTLSGQFNKVKAGLENLAISTGQALAPAITTILKLVSPVLNAIAGFLSANPLLISGLVGLGVAIGAVNLVMTAWAARTLAVNFVMAAQSAILGGLSAGAYTLSAAWQALLAVNPAATLAITNAALTAQSALLRVGNSAIIQRLGLQKVWVTSNALLTKSTLLFNNALTFVKANLLLSAGLLAGLVVAAVAVGETWSAATEDIRATNKALEEIEESMKAVEVEPIKVGVEVDERSLAADKISQSFGVVNKALEFLRTGVRLLMKPTALVFGFMKSILEKTSSVTSELLQKFGVVGVFIDENINKPLTKLSSSLLSVGQSIGNVTSLAEQKVNARSVAFSDLLVGIDSYNNKVNKLITDAKASPTNDKLKEESAAMAKSLDLQIKKLQESKTVTQAEASVKDAYIKSLTSQSKALKEVSGASNSAVKSGEALADEFGDITEAAGDSTQSFDDFKSGLEDALNAEFEKEEEAISKTNEKREEGLQEQLDKKLENIDKAAEAEEAAIDSTFAKQDEALDRKRTLEDRARDRQREAEDAARDKAAEAVEKALEDEFNAREESIDKAAEAEEKGIQKAFDARESALDKLATAEEKAIDKANAKVIANLEKQQQLKLKQLEDEFNAREEALEKENEAAIKARQDNFDRGQESAKTNFDKSEESAKLAFETKLNLSQQKATDAIEALKVKYDKQRQDRQSRFEASQLKKKEVAESAIAAKVAKESAAIDANKSQALSKVEAEFAQRRRQLELANASPEERQQLEDKFAKEDKDNAGLNQLAAEEAARKQAIEEQAQRQAEELKKKEEAEKKALEENLAKEAEAKAKIEEELKAKEEAEIAEKEAAKAEAAKQATLAFETELEARKVAFEESQNEAKRVFETELEARKVAFEEAKKQRELEYETQKEALVAEQEAAKAAIEEEQEEAKAKREEAREAAKEKRQEAFEEAKAKREEAREAAKEKRQEAFEEAKAKREEARAAEQQRIDDQREEEDYQKDQQRQEADAQRDLQREQEKQAREDEREAQKTALQAQYDAEKLAREKQAEQDAEARRKAHEQEIASIQLQTAEQLEAKYKEITAAMKQNLAEIAAIAAANKPAPNSGKGGNSPRPGGKRYKGGRVLEGLGYWVGENPITGALLPSSEYFVPDTSGYVFSAADVSLWRRLLAQSDLPRPNITLKGGSGGVIPVPGYTDMEQTNKLLTSINTRLASITDPYSKAVKVKPPTEAKPKLTYTI